MNKQLLKELTQLNGAAGYEREVREYIHEYVKPYADSIMVDGIGNLIVYKKGNGENKKKIMVAGHMDEVGFQVLKIGKDGVVKFSQLGMLFYHTTYMSRVRFQKSGIVGIVSNVADVGDGGGMDKFCIELGATSNEEIEKHLRIGDVGCYIGDFEELLENRVTAKALDDRIGCYILMEALKDLGTPYNDVYFVFTVQEELGCRGSKVSAARIQPDIGIAVDVTPAGDYPCTHNEGPNTLGEGAAIKVMDPSVICNEYLVDTMIDCAKENNIKYQLDIITRGGTDAGPISETGCGVRSCGISVPLRYPHGPNGVADLSDIQASVDLLRAYVNVPFTFEV